MFYNVVLSDIMSTIFVKKLFSLCLRPSYIDGNMLFCAGFSRGHSGEISDKFLCGGGIGGGSPITGGNDDDTDMLNKIK